jgi:hypothetical protein
VEVPVILKFLSRVRLSMSSSRRTMPIPPDFSSALVSLNCALPTDQLKPYTHQPAINPPLYPTPPPDDEYHNITPLPSKFLGPELDGHGRLRQYTYATKGLPELPSAHTFRDTPVFPKRESDTRRIRELATHEGKLGEQALRKLAGAARLDASSHPIDTNASDSRTQKQASTTRQQRRKRWKNTIDTPEEVVFEETVRELLGKEAGGFELGPIVNAEKGFRMPDDVAVKRRARVEGGSGSKGDGGGGDVEMVL